MNLNKKFTSDCYKQTQLNNKNFGKQIRSLSKIYRELHEIVEEFNRLFGWQIFFSLIIIGVVTLSLLDWIFLFHTGIKTVDLGLNPLALAANVISTLVNFVSYQIL